MIVVGSVGTVTAAVVHAATASTGSAPVVRLMAHGRPAQAGLVTSHWGRGWGPSAPSSQSI